MDNTHGWGKWSNSTEGENPDGTLAQNVAKTAGIEVEAGKWFTLKYDITGTTYAQFDQANMPADEATGPFYFGVGIAGHTPDGSNGYAEAARAMVDGSNPPAVEILVKDLKRAEKIALNNAWYAVYRFDLPAGKTWEDYKGAKASYMFEEEDLANAIPRGARLMGPYTPGDFTFYTDAEGINLAVANYNGGKNAPFIINNKYGWGSFAKDLVDKLAGEGIDVVVGKWFGLEYDISGAKPPAHNDFANKPADDATGPFYFGLGLTGQDNGGNVHYIANVKLLGYDATVPDVIGLPAYLDNPDDTTQTNIPVFAGYNTPDGSNGYADAARSGNAFVFTK